MILKTLNLGHFGAFHQVKISLQPGMNVIYGENESGKTTLHQFIQAMLFGVERLRGRASKNDAYTRFQPWEQGRSYEGALEFSHEGEIYRIYRNFYKEDEAFRIEQLSTGKAMVLAGGRIDELVEGLTRPNYKNVLSVGQLANGIDAQFGLSLQAYMANVKRTKSEEVDIQKTLDYLKKERRNRVDKSSMKQIQALKAQAEGLTVMQGDKDRLIEEIQGKQEALGKLRQEIASGRQADREQWKAAQRERMEAIRLIEENNRIAALYKEKKAAYETLKQQRTEDDFDAMKDRWDEANQTYNEVSHQYSQLWGRNLAILFSVLMFGLIPVVGVFFLQSRWGFRMGAIGLLAAVLVCVGVLLKNGHRRMGREMAKRKAELDQIHEMMEARLFGLGGRAALKRLQEELRGLRDDYERIQIPLQPYLEKYGEDISVDMDEALEESQTESLREKEADLMRRLERLMVEREQMAQRETEKAMLEEEIERLALDAEAEQEEIECIDLCAAMIQEVSEEIHSGFGPALNHSVSEMMKSLTGGKYERMVVDSALHPKIDTGSRFAEGEQLSTGTREQMYLALRMGMVQLLFEDSEVPILFDDSFVCYDDRRLARTLSWLAEKNMGQVIIFTCQRREMEILDRLGIDYHPVYLTA